MFHSQFCHFWPSHVVFGGHTPWRSKICNFFVRFAIKTNSILSVYWLRENAQPCSSQNINQNLKSRPFWAQNLMNLTINLNVEKFKNKIWRNILIVMYSINYVFWLILYKSGQCSIFRNKCNDLSIDWEPWKCGLRLIGTESFYWNYQNYNY